MSINRIQNHLKPTTLGSLILTLIALIAAIYYGWFYYFFYNAKPWVTGYLPAYHHTEQPIGFLAAADYRMLSHINHASAIPRPDGSLDTDTNGYRPASRQRAVQTAKEQKLPILLTVTGAYDLFMPAISDSLTRQTFIHHILQLLDTDGYDGVDVDMEPVTRDANQPNPAYTAFITELHSALQQRYNRKLNRPPLLTTAVSFYDRYAVAALADKFDQINIMTYDMAQPYDGWISWYDSALYNGGMVFPGLGNPLPAIDGWVNEFLQAGIPRRKLGIGISLDVACWSGGEGTSTGGVSAPRQAWTKPPLYEKRSYADMARAGLLPAKWEWDEVTHMAWFGVDAPGSANDHFCNFNDANAIADKITYVKEHGLGGVIIWELGLDQRDDVPKEQSRPLRQAIEAALKK